MAKRTLFIRGIEDTTVDKLKHAAAVRNLTLGEYIARLADLHDLVRQRADAKTWTPSSHIQGDLTTLGLQTITG